MHLELEIFGRRLSLQTKAPANLQPIDSRGSSSWWSIVREPYAGAWQRNDALTPTNVLTYSAVFACVTLIAADIGKLCLRLVSQDDEGIWTETVNPAFSPVLRKPNHYQTRIKFVEQWITSKLNFGNTYVLKQRDQRGVVTKLYVLDPTRVKPLVSQSGDVFYELRRDDLSELPRDTVTVPAREIIHDTMVTLFHPLCGVTPLFACGLAAVQGLAIQSNSTKFFQKGNLAPGILTAPGDIADTQAARLKQRWEESYTGDNIGKVAVLGSGLKFEAMAVNAVDAQLIEQLKWTAETVCSCYHVPPYMIGVGPPPPYANIEPLLQQYYSQCIQSLLTNFELCLDEGLAIDQPINGTQYGTEFDIDDLIWMDTATKTKAAADGIGGGAMSPDEARKKYFGLGPVEGGDTPYMQQQMYSLKALAERDADQPFSKPTPAPVAAPADTPAAQQAASFGAALRRKARERWPRAA